MNRIKKGDEVIVITGKDKGSRGVVRRLVGSEKVLVDGVNMVKKHMKPNPNKNQTGGIVDMEAPLNVSNIMHYNPQTQKAGRIGYKNLEDGRKVRYFKSTGELLDI